MEKWIEKNMRQFFNNFLFSYEIKNTKSIPKVEFVPTRKNKNLNLKFL